jgi:hypothetical protein
MKSFQPTTIDVLDILTYLLQRVMETVGLITVHRYGITMIYHFKLNNNCRKSGKQLTITWVSIIYMYE